MDRFRVLYPREEPRALVEYALFYAFLSGVTGLLILRWPLPLMGSQDFLCDYWYFLVFKFAFLLVLPMAAFVRLGYRWRDFAPGGLSLRDISWSVLGAMIAYRVNGGYLWFVLDRIEQGGFDPVLPRVFLGLVIPLFCAALPEELFFRGWMQTRLEQRYGRIVAIFLTAILFTLFHIPSRYFLAYGVEGHAGDWPSILKHAMNFIFLIGLLECFFWDRYRRIAPLIAWHWAMDAFPWIAGMLNIRI